MNSISNSCFLKSPTDHTNGRNPKEQHVPTIPYPVPTLPGRKEMHAIFSMCRKNQWNSVLRCVQANPQIPVTSMIMDNHISTTILHQAITSKGNTELRAKVIRTILKMAPQAAAIKNGYGSLPLHVIAQRNTKMDAPTKELLITELVRSFEGALLQPGGVGKRTPLHIISIGSYCELQTAKRSFLDFGAHTIFLVFSSLLYRLHFSRMTRLMIQFGPQACFMRDKKGYLPAHVACSRHCSPEKLRMLLTVNPESLVAKTNDGQTLISLAIGTATSSHPNYALIDTLRSKLDGIDDRIDMSRRISIRKQLQPTRRRAATAVTATSTGRRKHQHWRAALANHRSGSKSNGTAQKAWDNTSSRAPSSLTAPSTRSAVAVVSNCSLDYQNGSKRKGNIRKVTDESNAPAPAMQRSEIEDDPVLLLLHFSRQTDETQRVAEV